MRPRQLDFAAKDADDRKKAANASIGIANIPASGPAERFGDESEELKTHSSHLNTVEEKREPGVSIRAAADSWARASDTPSDVTSPAVTDAHRQNSDGEGTRTQINGPAAQSSPVLNSQTASVTQPSAFPLKHTPLPTQADATTLPHAAAVAAAPAAASVSAIASHSSPQSPPSTQQAATGMQAAALGGRLRLAGAQEGTATMAERAAAAAAVAAAASDDGRVGIQVHSLSQSEAQVQAQATEGSPGTATVTPR